MGSETMPGAVHWPVLASEDQYLGAPHQRSHHRRYRRASRRILACGRRDSFADGLHPRAGTVRTRADQTPNAQEPDSIPLLLLQATSTGGTGLLARTRYVQRLNTLGGQALPQACTQEGQENRMPYRADYVFLE